MNLKSYNKPRSAGRGCNEPPRLADASACRPDRSAHARQQSAPVGITDVRMEARGQRRSTRSEFWRKQRQ